MASVPNLHTNVLLRSEQSGGHVSVMENIVRARSAGPPLHTHDFDEAFYMLEGELVFQVEDELFTKRRGRDRVRPAQRRPHARQPQRRGRALSARLHAGGLERHFARIAAASQGVEPPDWALQPSPEITASARRSRGRRAERDAPAA